MRSNHHRSGFTLILALLLLAFVGVAISVVGILMRTDLRRTDDEVADMQLRQLIQAAALDAPVHLKAGDRVSYFADVPKRLDAQVEITANGGDVAIAAVMVGRRLSETMQFTEDSGGWKLSGAQLNPATRVR